MHPTEETDVFPPGEVLWGQHARTGGRIRHDQSPGEHQPIAAFVLALLAGVWMLASGVMRDSWGRHLQSERMWGAPMGGGWMWHHGMLWSVALTFWWPWVGLIVGSVVLICAVMLLLSALNL
jgi:hypothetical protein